MSWIRIYKENNIRYNSIVGLKEEYIAEIMINKEVKIDNKNRIRNLIYIKRKNTATNNIVDRANNGTINLRTFPKGWIKELNPYCIA